MGDMNVLWLCITLQKSSLLFCLKVDFQINQNQTSSIKERLMCSDKYCPGVCLLGYSSSHKASAQQQFANVINKFFCWT